MQKTWSKSNIEIIHKNWTLVQVGITIRFTKSQNSWISSLSSWTWASGESFFFSSHITHRTLLENQNQFHNQQREPQPYLPIFSKDFRDFASKNSFPSFDVLIREPTGFAFAFTFCPSVACNLTLIINQTNVLSSYNQSWKLYRLNVKETLLGLLSNLSNNNVFTSC